MIGQHLGPYEILEQIGKGGMGTVYKAYQASMDRYVAIKVLPPNLAQDPSFAARFKRETHTITHLLHPNILQIYDSGNQDGVAYIVMPYLERTLADLIEDSQLSLRFSVRLIQRVAEALDHAHSQGVIHRDIKPSNILIDTNSQPYLADFGIVKLLDESLSSLTGLAIVGTPAYMSPEQAQGSRDIDPRSDIYSLGVVLYQLVTGRLPFEADTNAAMMRMHTDAPLPPPRNFVPNLPVALEEVITKALAKKPNDRYASAGMFAEALERALLDISRPETPTPLPVPRSQNQGPTPPTVTIIPGMVGAGIGAVAVAVFFVALLLVGLIVFIVNSQPEKNTPVAYTVAPTNTTALIEPAPVQPTPTNTHTSTKTFMPTLPPTLTLIPTQTGTPTTTPTPTRIFSIYIGTLIVIVWNTWDTDISVQLIDGQFFGWRNSANSNGRPAIFDGDDSKQKGIPVGNYTLQVKKTETDEFLGSFPLNIKCRQFSQTKIEFEISEQNGQIKVSLRGCSHK